MKIAIAQLNCTVGDLAGNAARIADAAGRALALGADVMVTPELSLSGYPPEDLLLKFPRDARAAFIAGGSEYFVRSGDFARRMAKVRQLAPVTQEFIVPQADHFFLLSHTTQTMAKLREWMPGP